MDNCPCGLDQVYAACCGAYISGKTIAPNPESLMRSRYSAYVKGEVDYIANTQSGKAAIGFDKVQAKAWSEQADWKSLTVLNTKQDGDKGEVEFMSHYILQGRPSYMHERSQFERIDGVWFYTDGKFVKTGRNDLCPCGSQKKFKKCCGVD